jgi:DMSO/TMAO reductase YedYZ molybdopterin-dependent catalytic subunit
MPEALPGAATWHLRVDGLVGRTLTLTADDLRALPRVEHQGSFTCERGWEAGRLRWQGGSLGALLAMAGPLPAATALVAHDVGGFRSLVPLESAKYALLADELDGHTLTAERGAPCRLVVTDPACQLSMKWLARLELVQRSPDESPGPRRPPER